MRPGRYVPPAIALAALGVGLLNGAPLVAQGAAVARPRVAPHADEGFTRVVLDLAGAPTFSSQLRGRTLEVVMRGLGVLPGSGAANTNELASWSLENRGGDGVLSLKAKHDLAATKGFTAFALRPSGGDGHRLVVDLGPKLSPRVAARVAPPIPSTTTAVAPAARPTAGPAPAAVRPPERAAPTVVLDPGHGGVDPGAVSPYVREKEVTLSVALKTRALLQAAGVKVEMTRSTDWAWQRDKSKVEKTRDLSERAKMASTKKNVFVSIHVNSAAAPAARGVETFVFGEPIEPGTLAQAERENGGGAIGRAVTNLARDYYRSLIGNQLAQENLAFSRRLAQRVQAGVLGQTGAPSRGVKSNSLYVIRFARIPAILVEIGFGSNPVEGRSLAQDAYRNRVARGIADGVLQFLGRD